MVERLVRPAPLGARRLHLLTFPLGITLPSKEAQVANIRSVYASAGLSFDQTAYVECHGTGTQAGDWRELKAISETIGKGRPADRPILVGSIKPNIGHLEGAAGVAGLIKGVLILEHGRIPRNINFENGNPDINFHEWRVQVSFQYLLFATVINNFEGSSKDHGMADSRPEKSQRELLRFRGYQCPRNYGRSAKATSFTVYRRGCK